MELTVLQENLSSALKDMSPFIQGTLPVPLLENILIQVENNKLKISATDLLIGIQKEIRAKILKEGKICVNARRFSSFINQIPPGKIDILLEKTQLLVKTERTQAEFNTVAPDDFPSLEPISQKNIIKKELIKEVSQQITGAASTDEARNVLTGISFENKNGRTRIAATDGFRLSLKEIEGELIKEGTESLIVPARLFADIAKIIPGDKDLYFELGENKTLLKIAWEETLVNVQLIEGTFPDFERIVPSGFVTQVIVDKDSFERIIKTAAIFAQESSNIVKVVFKEDFIEVSANSPKVGINTNRVAAVIDGEEQKIAFNFRFLLDFLKSVESEEIIIQLSGSLKPCVFRAKGREDYLHIIMPVRVQEETQHASTS